MKIIEQNFVALPINIYSSMDDSACGIQLEIGHNYLISGIFLIFNFYF
jgi:hypothetical protein